MSGSDLHPPCHPTGRLIIGCEIVCESCGNSWDATGVASESNEPDALGIGEYPGCGSIDPISGDQCYRTRHKGPHSSFRHHWTDTKGKAK